MIEKVVEAFNRHIERKRLEKGIRGTCYLAARKRIEETSQFKAYKVAIVEVLMIGEGVPRTAFRAMYEGRILEQHKEYVLSDLEIKVTELILDFIAKQGSDYNNLIEGKYEGYPEDE